MAVPPAGCGEDQCRPDGKEHTPEEAIGLISQAGYAGVDLVSSLDYAEKRDRWIAAVKGSELDVTFTAFCSETDPLEPTIEAALKLRERVRYINLIPRTLYWDLDEAAM
jgi:sugar phosphate isomerase/epimerase